MGSSNDTSDEIQTHPRVAKKRCRIGVHKQRRLSVYPKSQGTKMIGLKHEQMKQNLYLFHESLHTNPEAKVSDFILSKLQCDIDYESFRYLPQRIESCQTPTDRLRRTSVVDRGSSWCHIDRICEYLYLARFLDETSSVGVVIDGNVLWVLGFGGLEDGRDLGLKANKWGPFSISDSHQTINSPLKDWTISPSACQRCSILLHRFRSSPILPQLLWRHQFDF